MQLDAQGQSIQSQLPPPPIQPSCVLGSIFTSSDCVDRWNAYRQAVAVRQQQGIQLYVNREKEIASAPLQQQIASLNKLVADQQGQMKSLHEQMQAQTVAASQSAIVAQKEAWQQGAGIGFGAALLLFALVYGIRKMTRGFTISKKAHAASA